MSALLRTVHCFGVIMKYINLWLFYYDKIQCYLILDFDLTKGLHHGLLIPGALFLFIYLTLKITLPHVIPKKFISFRLTFSLRSPFLV